MKIKFEKLKGHPEEITANNIDAAIEYFKPFKKLWNYEITITKGDEIKGLDKLNDLLSKLIDSECKHDIKKKNNLGIEFCVDCGEMFYMESLKDLSNVKNYNTAYVITNW